MSARIILTGLKSNITTQIVTTLDIKIAALVIPTLFQIANARLRTLSKAHSFNVSS